MKKKKPEPLCFVKLTAYQGVGRVISCRECVFKKECNRIRSTVPDERREFIESLAGDRDVLRINLENCPGSEYALACYDVLAERLIRLQVKVDLIGGAIFEAYGEGALESLDKRAQVCSGDIDTAVDEYRKKISENSSASE